MSRALLALSAGASALIVGAGLSGGSLLMRDAVSTPRSFLTDAALGLAQNPARAVPQDALIAAASTVIPGTLVVAAVTWIALCLSGIGAGTLARRVLPDGGWAPSAGAALVAVWNPWVAERLMQGHWSLLTGYAAVPWILVAAQRIWCAERAAWPLLWVAVIGAGLTPSGSVLAGLVVVVAVLLPAGRTLRRSAGALAAVVVGALPWLVASVIGASVATGDPVGAHAFSLRAEPGLGRVLTALGMGGIWNADAVPASRTMWWAAVATVLLLLVVVVGWRELVSLHSAASEYSRRLAVICAALALGAVTVVVLGSTSPGLTVLAGLLEHVPGAGLLRDTHKYLALMLPAVALGVAGTVRSVTRLVPQAFALTAIAVLVVAPFPDAAFRVHPITLPADWSTVAATVPADGGAVALWPTGMTRDYSFAPTQSLDPARRMLRAPVLESGTLRVGGRVVDADPTTRAARVERALEQGAGPAVMASHGVGWLLVEEPDRNGIPGGFASVTPVFEGDYLTLYRIENPVLVPGASAWQRGIVGGAHVIWVLALLCAIALLARRRASTRSATPA